MDRLDFLYFHFGLLPNLALIIGFSAQAENGSQQVWRVVCSVRGLGVLAGLSGSGRYWFLGDSRTAWGSPCIRDMVTLEISGPYAQSDGSLVAAEHPAVLSHLTRCFEGWGLAAPYDWLPPSGTITKAAAGQSPPWWDPSPWLHLKKLWSKPLRECRRGPRVIASLALTEIKIR